MPQKELTSFDRFLITLAVMSATLIQVLDITIVNVALPHMQGSLSATPDQITWVITSYLVASAILMPLTGFLTDRLGRKNYLLISIFGFVVSSILCGAATSITQIVLFRILQGIFGASLVPLSQAILADIYPPEDRGKAMAIWGIGVMIGPILGPTLGGYLTEIANWRLNFFINVPVGILSFIIAFNSVPETKKQNRKMDWIGFFFLAIAIGSTQYFLDRGTHADWFESFEIQLAAVCAVIGWFAFLINIKSQKKYCVFDLHIFKDRNFNLASFLMGAFGLGFFSILVLFPLMLENLFNYPVLTAGLIMAPRGISGMVSMLIVSRLIKYVETRTLILIGMILTASGTFIGTFYNLQIDTHWIIWPFILQGLGIGMVFVPLSSNAFITLPSHLRSEAAGLFSLVRTIGQSIGVSIIITIFTRHGQIAWHNIGTWINPYHIAVTEYLQNLHLSLDNPLALTILGNELLRQSQMLAFIDTFFFITGSFIVLLPFVFLIRRVKMKIEMSSTHIE